VAYNYFRVAVSYNVESGKDTHTREVAGSMLAHATLLHLLAVSPTEVRALCVCCMGYDRRIERLELTREVR
jgi:hypothetical protein